MATERRYEAAPLLKLFEPVLPYQSSMYMTVLNIIQALALGFLVNEIREAAVKNDLGLILWLRSMVAFTIILLVWHNYTSEAQYLWPTQWDDTIGTFSIGILEFGVAFSVNPHVASLKFFLLAIAMLQVSASFAYANVYLIRSMEFTIKIYKDFYREHPMFESYLANFLKKFDRFRAILYGVAAGISFLMVGLMALLPSNLCEIGFPIIYFSYFAIGEMVGNFQLSRKKDVFLGLYFS